MRKFLMTAVLSAGGIAGTGLAADSPDAIVRKPLLTAQIGGKSVERVEVKEIEFSPAQKTGIHLHPCPVVGYIVSGSVAFQVEGQPEQTLHAGDAFYEPANTRILRFDAVERQTRFIASYLLGKDDHELIRHLDQP